jgi:hypothetical protein
MLMTALSRGGWGTEEEDSASPGWPMESRTGRVESSTGSQKSLRADRGQRATPAPAIATPAKRAANARPRVGRRAAAGGAGAGATTVATSKSAFRDGA